MDRETDLTYIGKLHPGMPTVLFIPGAMTNPNVFAGFANYLPCQSAIIDWNNSEGPWQVDVIGRRVLELIDKKKLGPTVLAGYSWGGVVSLAAAIFDKKDRVKGIMVADTGACAIGHGDPDFPQKLERRWPDKELFRMFSARCFARPITRGLYQQLEDYAMALGKDTVCQAAHSVRETDFRDRLDQITCPVQILHGLRDQSRSKRHAEIWPRGLRARSCFGWTAGIRPWWRCTRSISKSCSILSTGSGWWTIRWRWTCCRCVFSDRKAREGNCGCSPSL